MRYAPPRRESTQGSPPLSAVVSSIDPSLCLNFDEMRPAEGPRESAASSASSHPGERGSDPSDAPCVRAFASTRLRLREDSSTTSACT